VSQNEHFADRLLAAIKRKGTAACVGIDPVYERLPAQLLEGRRAGREPIETVRAFCRSVLEAVEPTVPVVKLQSAYFERYGHAGVRLYFELAEYARRRLGLLVIGDVKRGDIGSTAEAYAAAHLCEKAAPDAITVNGYFGADGLAPFVEAARRANKGIFVLVRTSNPSAAAIQDFSDAAGKRFYEHIAGQVASLGRAEGLVGRQGYSCIGAVVGATYPEEARRLRELMPQQIFLVPGYGAQGASGEDCAAAFKTDGTGAIVSASRSVIYAHQRPEYADADWLSAIGQAASDFAADIRRATGQVR